MFYRICFASLFCFSLFSAEHVFLKTPNISRDNIIGTNVGIRPFRKSGVRIEAEKIQDKLIIHNYGYGGSGLTLAFGGAEQVLDLLNQEKPSSKSVAVLGAGVVGLAAAYDLLEQGYDVHLYADNWNPYLTSNVAAGIWSPLSLPKDLPEEKKKLHQQLLETSEIRFLKSTTDTPEFAGVKLITAYSCRQKKAGDEVILHFDNGTIKNCQRVYEVGLNGKFFLEDLNAKVKDKGVIWQQCHFENLEEILNLEEPTIINCLSIGSMNLFQDQEFIPARGQIIYFKHQEEIDYLFFQEVDNNYFVFIYPWNDRLILGGVYEFGEDELKVNPDTINRILENAEKCFSVSS